MIVPITGNVNYTITLDPTVWIFDDRKILLEEAFTQKEESNLEDHELEKAAQRWNRAIYPPINKGMTRKERNEVLENSYVMPIIDFVHKAEIKENATNATLVTTNGDVNISIPGLKDGYFLFAVDGSVIKDDGPVHFYYRDGSNKDTPIKGIQKIVIK